MTYQQDSELYRDLNQRNRAEMCIREQAYIFSGNSDPAIAALGQGVVAGNATDIDAVYAAICTAPGVGDLSDDAVLLSATQAVWPTVAAARYPQP